FCVWANTSFAAGRGISIIATQNLAESVAKSEGYQSARRVRASGGGSQASPKYEVKTLPGRGLGLVANHTLVRGDDIVYEPPVVLAQHDIEDLLGEGEVATLHRVAVERLPYRTRADAMNLHGYGGKGTAYDRFSANAFKVYEFAGIFPMVARINHDCRPNAHFYFDKKTFTHRIHAVRTIAPGEEITISYLSHYLTSDERAHRTTSQWGFECLCRLCRVPQDKLNDSDNRLKRMQQIEAFFLDGSQDETTANPAMAEELIQLYQEERLDVPISRAYGYAS
ncbi:SET domain-containing protein, partial [Lindgomyces ingoldianus]